MTQTELEKGLEDNELAFVPHYIAPGKCNSVAIPFNYGKKRAWVHIEMVPVAKKKEDGTTSMGHMGLTTCVLQ